MALSVRNIGSHMAGEKSNTLPDLMKMLQQHPLNPLFEDYGNFVYKLEPEEIKRLGFQYHIHGNFYQYSYVFDIKADTKADTLKLCCTIRENQRRADYKAARVLWLKEKARKKAEERERLMLARGH
jgi:hypothetical protein